MDKRRKQLEAKLQKRDSYLKRYYGMSLQDYKIMLDKQDGKCYICQRNAEEFTKNLCVDHDHKTGEVRGLLCNYCNKYLVGRHRDPKIIYRIYEYLSQPRPGFIVPKKKKRSRKGGKRHTSNP